MSIFAPPTQQQLGVVAEPVWSGVKDSPPILILNQDPNNTVFIGYSNDIQVGATNTYMLQPLSSCSFDGSRTIYAVSVSDTLPVQILPGGQNPTLSPLALGAALVTSGIAVQIAQAILQTGVPIVTVPIPLYGGTQNIAGQGLVGYGTSGPEYGFPSTIQGDLQAFSVLDAAIGRPIATAVQRRYYKEGTYPSAQGDNQNVVGLVANGIKVAITFKPLRDGTSAYTGAQFVQEKQNLTNAINYYLSNGVPANMIEICLWHEANGFGKAGPFGNGSQDKDGSPYPANTTTAQAIANYAAYIAYYGPAVTALGVKLWYVAAMFSPDTAVTFFPTASLALFTGIAADYYETYFSNNNITLTGLFGGNAVSIIGLANANNLAFGIWELGACGGPKNPPTPDQLASWMATQVVAPMQAQLNASHVNGDVIWFGFVGSGGCNHVDNTTSLAEIKAFQNMFDLLSQIPVSTITVGAGATVTVPPLKPSPNAGYAIAQGIAYDISISAVAGAGSTIPWAQIRLHWFNTDSPSAQEVSHQHWSIPMSTAAVGASIIGVGPQHGQYLKIAVTNSDTQPCTLQIQVNSTSRNYTRHDWFWDAASSPAIPTYTPAGGGASYANQLAVMTALNIPHGGTPISRLCSLFSGQVWLYANPSAANQITMSLNPQPSSIFGNAADLSVLLTGEYDKILLLPRGPCLVTFTNADGVNDHTVDFQLVAMD